MGNAFGESQDQVTLGSVSALHRTVTASGENQAQLLTNVIQSSAQLYPGDSGGPLFDLNGNVVGIDVAAAVNKPDISFSIPINDAKTVIAAVAGNQE